MSKMALKKFSSEKYNEKTLTSFFVRVGLSIVFLYAGTAAVLDPLSWMGFIPSWVRAIIPPAIFLPLHAAMDMAIGLWLLSGWKRFYAGLVASLALLSIIVFNLGALDIIFRDIALFFSAVAVMALHWQEVKER